MRQPGPSVSETRRVSRPGIWKGYFCAFCWAVSLQQGVICFRTLRKEGCEEEEGRETQPADLGTVDVSVVTGQVAAACWGRTQCPLCPQKHFRSNWHCEWKKRSWGLLCWVKITFGAYCVGEGLTWLCSSEPPGGTVLPFYHPRETKQTEARLS